MEELMITPRGAPLQPKKQNCRKSARVIKGPIKLRPKQLVADRAIQNENCLEIVEGEQLFQSGRNNQLFYHRKKKTADIYALNDKRLKAIQKLVKLREEIEERLNETSDELQTIQRQRDLESAHQLNEQLLDVVLDKQSLELIFLSCRLGLEDGKEQVSISNFFHMIAREIYGKASIIYGQEKEEMLSSKLNDLCTLFFLSTNGTKILTVELFNLYIKDDFHSTYREMHTLISFIRQYQAAVVLQQSIRKYILKVSDDSAYCGRIAKYNKLLLTEPEEKELPFKDGCGFDTEQFEGKQHEEKEKEIHDLPEKKLIIRKEFSEMISIKQKYASIIKTHFAYHYSPKLLHQYIKSSLQIKNLNIKELRLSGKELVYLIYHVSMKPDEEDFITAEAAFKMLIPSAIHRKRLFRALDQF